MSEHLHLWTSASLAGADVQNLGNVESGKASELHPVEKIELKSIFCVSLLSLFLRLWKAKILHHLLSYRIHPSPF